MENYVVSNSPFIRKQNDINKMFMMISIALVVPAIYGVMFFGIRALFVILISVVTCFLCELIFSLFEFKKVVIDDFSFLVTGLVFALTLPYNIPYWIVILSAVFAILIVKIAFGGLGRNKFNPACTARCFAGVVSAGLAGAFYEITLNGEALTSIALGGSNTILNILTGQAVGGIGTTCILVILLCYVFLVYSGVINFEIPLIAALAYFLTSFLLVGIDQCLINICSGSFLFVCVFMLPEPNTSPDSLIGRILYSVMFGALSALVWNMGVLGENTVFAVLLFVNLWAPFMDEYFVLKPLRLGGYRNAYKN